MPGAAGATPALPPPFSEPLRWLRHGPYAMVARLDETGDATRTMTTTTLDTLAIARKLKAAGFSDDQAEAVTGVIREVRESDLSALVTNSTLKAELSDAKYDILKWVLSAIGFQTIVVVGAIITLTKGLR